MIKNTEYSIITFRSTSAAMAAEEYFKSNSVPGRIIPLPGSISAGCGLAWRMLPNEYEKIKNNLSIDGIEGVHIITMKTL